MHDSFISVTRSPFFNPALSARESSHEKNKIVYFYNRKLEFDQLSGNNRKLSAILRFLFNFRLVF